MADNIEIIGHHRQLPGGFAQHRNYLMMTAEEQFEHFRRKTRSKFKADAAESVYFNRQLENLWARAYRVKYSNLQGRLFVPKDTETKPWAEGYRYVSYDHVGAAALLKNYSEEVPSCDVAGKEHFGRCWGWGNSFGWGIMESMQQEALGSNLSTEKQSASRRILEERVDESIARGDPEDFNAYGLLNNPNVPLLVLPLGVDGFVEWDKKRPLEVVNDLTLIKNSIRRRTKEVERGNTMILPPGAVSFIETTPISADNPNTSILEYFLSKNRDVVAVEGWYRCNDAGAGGTCRGVCYDRSDEQLKAIIPMEYTMLPPQQVGFKTAVLAHLRVGGVQWMYPLSGVYFDGFLSAQYLNG